MATDAKADPEPHCREDDDNAPATAADDEDTGAQVAPIVKLEKKAKLYRFDKEGNQWKERGVGNVKLLKHKVNGKVRLVMRQSKPLRSVLTISVFIPTMTVQEHSGNDKSCVWHAADFADGNLKEEMFCIRFASVENCKTFMETVQDVAESQGKKEENKDATVTADLLDKLSVGESKSDGKEEDTVVASDTKEAVKDEAKTEEDKKDEAASKA
ncbi:hypothetical protein ERO13_A01G226640v2 [Gossypium hirsutum]|nr:hypothetical protein ERO13_A01G226640v2 [Gossypium hirsutum]